MRRILFSRYRLFADWVANPEFGAEWFTGFTLFSGVKMKTSVV